MGSVPSSLRPLLTQECIKTTKDGCFVIGGIFFAFLSGVLFASNNTLIKFFDIDFEDILLVRAIVTTIGLTFL